ncbi:MAG TPA: glutaminyl-peptide cyclotransferase [Flavobacterium sp.]|jgi:glutamine cyclotransferase
MKKYNWFVFILLAVVALGCDGSRKQGEKYFSVDATKLKQHYLPSDKLEIVVLNEQKKSIDSIAFYLNDKRFSSVRGHKQAEASLSGAKLGYQNIKALVYYEAQTSGQEITARIEVVSPVQPKLLNFTVVRTYPHDVTAFTEGLEFYRDTLLESTGQNGKSWIRKYDYQTGKTYKQVDLTQEYFGEGITVINNKVFQLTWQSEVGFIYNAGNLKLEKTFKYHKKVEGWGMTNDGKNIYHSDGTEKIWTMDPSTQKLTDYINVYSSTAKIKSINELEWIDGSIYGNIWQKNAIAVIDPATGSVTGVINLASLRKELKSPTAEVLNGIAYNPKTKTIFVTGKHWDKMFEIRIK